MSPAAVDVREEAVAVADGRITIRFKVAGNGPPLVYLHSMAGLTWSPLLDALAEDFTVYAPELPGTSPGDHAAIYELDSFLELLLAYEEALNQLGLERAVAVGVSFGGMVAADLAAVFPGLFSRLVLVSAIGLWRDDAPIPIVELLAATPEDAAKFLFHDTAGDAAREMLVPSVDAEDLPKLTAHATWSAGCAAKFAWPIADHGLRRRLHRIAVPTLLLWGRQDALVPAVYAEDFAAGIPDTEIVIVDEAGHEVQFDQPAATREAISGFLAVA